MKEELHSTSEIISKPVVPAPPSFIDREMMEKTLKGYELNNLYLFFCGRLGKENGLQLMRHYHVGTSGQVCVWGYLKPPKYLSTRAK